MAMTGTVAVERAGRRHPGPGPCYARRVGVVLLGSVAGATVRAEESDTGWRVERVLEGRDVLV